MGKERINFPHNSSFFVLTPLPTDERSHSNEYPTWRTNRAKKPREVGQKCWSLPTFSLQPGVCPPGSGLATRCLAPYVGFVLIYFSFKST
ncbi:hypothetical protein TNIN_197621 [Trichonephila inaurata madagascariensis]|uniref:Uncharacterized protein n=1 Tax=Trichonephila inaurata madagascariensis TaxID=2747483 RepID=A0A8X6KLR2_9ARAC|nr:hypothetical protein TNIN_197621 [Trichonephila inaurata madagascariensis]